MTSAIADRWTLFDRFLQNLRYKKVLNLIPHGCILADLGCGKGDFLGYISKRIASGYGIDATIKCSNTITEKKLGFKEGDLNRRIPLDSESVDIITALAVLEHLYSPEVFLTEILRILKPGGFCILTTPSPLAKPLLEFLAYKLKIISEKDIEDHKHYFSKKELMNTLIVAGFKAKNITIKSFQLGFNTIVVAKRESI